MKMEIARRFSIGGKRYKVRLDSIEENENIRRMKDSGLFDTFIQIKCDELGDGIYDHLLSKMKYDVILIIGRSAMRASVWSSDELGALAKVLTNLKTMTMREMGLNRYNRPKYIQRRY